MTAIQRAQKLLLAIITMMKSILSKGIQAEH